jgi:hypothetical protein
VTTQKMNDPAEYMMNKTRKAITDKINDYGIGSWPVIHGNGWLLEIFMGLC